MSPSAFATVIVQNTAGPFFGATNGFDGQSFTTPSSGGPWDDITFNFFSNLPPTTPTATGTGFLLSQEYLGTPSNLSSSTPGFLGASTGITGGMYVFPVTLELQPGTQYFVYGNAAIPTMTGGNNISGGINFFANTAANNFSPDNAGASANFSVFGTVVPEPSTWVMLLIGFAGLGFAFRRSRRKAAFA
jgi:hypothetical protein